MSEIMKIDTVRQYNDYFGVETLHLSVSVIEGCKAKPLRYCRKLYNLYAILLKDTDCGQLKYGQSCYDYRQGTMLFLAPGQIMGSEDDGRLHQPEGWVLAFHPEFLQKTPLARLIKEYSYFSYNANEALHLSEQERKIVLECMEKIRTELQHPIDKHSQRLIVSNIELFLNYCVRFYDRQFITRENVNKDILTRFENLLNDYFYSEKPESSGLPTVKYCADQMHLSANYFGDLIKKETGKTASEHIQTKLIDIAKEKVFDTGKTISEIAYELGFQYPQHFSRLFKKVVGVTPNEYRMLN